MKSSLLPVLSILPAATNAWVPSVPPPPAIIRSVETLQPAQQTALQRGRVMDLSSSSKVSSARIAAACRDNNKLSTIVPVQRAKHAGAQTVLNLSPLFGPGGPKPTDVVQGASGDCYLMAVLAAMAKHQPEALTSAIQPADASGDAYIIGYHPPMGQELGYTMVFDTSYVDQAGTPIYAGDAEQAVGANAVEASDMNVADVNAAGVGADANKAPHSVLPDKLSKASKQSSWVKVYENWFAKMNEQYALLNSRPGFEGISNGGWAAIPFKLLTGKDMDIVAPANLKEFKALLDQTDEGKIVILISNTQTFSEYYFPSTHAYAVLDHNGDKANIYDPHGRTLDLDDQVLFDNTVRVIVEKTA